MRAEIGLEYKGKIYLLSYDWSFSEEGLDFYWKEGNLACDCNRCLEIMEKCDAKFPDMKCGHEIKLIKFEIVKETKEEVKVT